MPFDIESSSVLRSLERDCNDEEVKKLTGLSSAELTFLPVARRFCVVLIRSAVFCSDSRFWRTPAERVIPIVLNLSGLVLPYWPSGRTGRYSLTALQDRRGFIRTPRVYEP